MGLTYVCGWEKRWYQVEWKEAGVRGESYEQGKPEHPISVERYF
jgi:hypothetical protein